MDRAKVVFEKLGLSTYVVKKRNTELQGLITSEGYKKTDRAGWVKKDTDLLDKNIGNLKGQYKKYHKRKKAYHGVIGGVSGGVVGGVGGLYGAARAGIKPGGKAGLAVAAAGAIGAGLGAMLASKSVKDKSDKVDKIARNYRITRAKMRDKTKGSKYNYYVKD
jgi:hypothetical protein